MSVVNDYRDLKVWQVSMSFAEDVYKLAKSLPNEERFGLADQLRRAVVSIPFNIAEGFGRESPKEFARFLAISRRSLFEVLTQIELVTRLGYLVSYEILLEKGTEISKMLVSLLQKVRMWQERNPQQTTKNKQLGTKNWN